MDIKQIIDRSGGQAQFAKLHGIPWLTVHRWYHGHNKPAEWLVRLLASATPKACDDCKRFVSGLVTHHDGGKVMTLCRECHGIRHGWPKAGG